MTESGSYGLSLVSIYFVPVNTYQRRKMSPTNSTTSGPFILGKLLTNIFQRIVFVTTEDKLQLKRYEVKTLFITK